MNGEQLKGLNGNGNRSERFGRKFKPFVGLSFFRDGDMGSKLLTLRWQAERSAHRTRYILLKQLQRPAFFKTEIDDPRPGLWTEEVKAVEPDFKGPVAERRFLKGFFQVLQLLLIHAADEKERHVQIIGMGNSLISFPEIFGLLKLAGNRMHLLGHPNPDKVMGGHLLCSFPGFHV
ncbi:hypothetical protein ABID49_001883 [Bhargavaea ullalensis]|uniref:Uncharacterized protein n=1 Tax=Bhargavaea ullalensis TaxID=1265685 RepID=A0ABV2GCG8_9BACL